MTDRIRFIVRLSQRWCRLQKWLAALCCCLLLAAPATAQEPSEGLALLQKIKQAASQLEYSGTFMYQHGSSLIASEIVHRLQDGERRERIEVLDGPQHREFLRVGKIVYSLLPEHEVVLVEVRETDHFPGWITGDPLAVGEYYDIELSPELGRVAGRPCVQARVTPRDDWRWGYQLCVDDATGLLLKLQTLDAEGDVLEQAVFSELVIGEPVAPEAFESSFNWRNWQHVKGGENADLSATGWQIDAPAGFVPVSEMRRKLKGRAKVHQMVLTDGLAAISVFIEPLAGELDERTASLAGYGATSIYRGALGEHWLTVLGEVPPHTVKAVADAVQH